MSRHNPSIEMLDARRRRLMRLVDDDSMVFLSAASPSIFSCDVERPYRQDSNFFYLTGFPEPDAIAVLTQKHGYTLFCQPRDRAAEQWTGRRQGCSKAVQVYGAKQAFPIHEFDNWLKEHLPGHDRLYCCLDSLLVKHLLPMATSGCRRGKRALQLIDLAPKVNQLRWRKDKEEVRLMKKATAITMVAHRRAMQVCRAGLYEYQIAASIEHEFAQSCARTAYPTIVGSGRNACILHYTENTRRFRNGDLVLIDAGAEYMNYAADVTRTFPVSGHFTNEQRDLYEIVLEAQLAAIKVAVPGNSKQCVHETAVRVLVSGLVRIGLLSGRTSQLIKSQDYRRFYMHGTSHWLGIDVHDCPLLPETNVASGMKPGMVLTIEPGLYIPAEQDIPKYWRGVGIRIEDDVLINKQGNEVLSGDLAKTPDEIEALMGA